jgi:threonine dehydratase
MKQPPIPLEAIESAGDLLRPIVARTPLQHSPRLSERYGARVYLKREDLQETRSFKIRGAYARIAAIPLADRHKGAVCASAGNHAQGVAASCALLRLHGTIFMPTVTPNQKIEKVRSYGEELIEVRLIGDTFDEANKAAQKFSAREGSTYVHPFDDATVIAGQGTVGKEIYEDLEGRLDYLVCCVGGGGLISGIASYLTQQPGEITVIGSEPAGAASMVAALHAGGPVTLDTMDTFVDGAAVQRTGNLTFALCQAYVASVIPVPEGRVCGEMLEFYQRDGIIAEPAGALAAAALEDLAGEIAGKTVVCVVSGGNNDVLRYPEVLERSLVYQGRKHYFIIEFAQKPGQLRRFVDQALGPTDDIVRFEYMKKTNKERGAALVGIELRSKDDYPALLQRMKALHLNFRELTSSDVLYHYVI